MTDEMRAREKAICEAANVKEIGDVSDGFHTFNGLYEQRMILFAALVKAYKNKAWKSYRHEDGEYCFGGGWFIVGIDTPEGSYTYHYENKYWDMFDCMDLPKGKHWDGHTEEDAETRLMSLNPEPHWISCSERLPEEEDSIFARYYGTDRWRKSMFRKKSREVIVTSVFEDGELHTEVAHTTDGEWHVGVNVVPRTVIAWMPLPEPFKGVTE